MIGLRQHVIASAWAHLTAAWLVAGSLLGPSGSLAADTNRLAWAPSRDEALIIDEGAAGAGAYDTVLSPSLLTQRPRSLSRPAPMRSQTFLTQAPGSSEMLPSVTGTPSALPGLEFPPGTYYDETGGVMASGPGNACCSPFGGDACGRGGWIPICICIPRLPRDGLEFFGGVHGFTGPANRGGSGSFGFHEGFNWGLPIAGCMAFQWGANWTQSNFEGNYLTTDSRNQLFLTGGLYRRVDWGFQGGVVFDYLHDDWDYCADLTQVRGELSWLWCGRNDIGFWFTTGINDAENLVVRRPVFAANSVRFADAPATLAVTDIYAFFFRRQFDCGGSGRLFGGFTDQGQGLVGGDAQLPLNACWSLRSSFIYAAPDGGDDPRFTRESWNIGISLVWTPCPRPATGQNYCRPLFNVADNGSFLTRLLP